MNESDNPKIEICLTQDEALVLFEWLSREDDAGSIHIAHPSEQAALWILEGKLEKSLPIFSSNYAALLETARSKLGNSQ